MKLQLAQITTSWPRIHLGELVDFLDNRRKPIKATERVAGPYPYYGANGLQDHVDGYLFDEKLVLLAEDGGYFFDETRSITYMVEGKCWVNNHAHVLRARQQVIPEFLNYQLGFADVKPFLSGSTRAKLTKGDASRIKIICPPLDEQRRIVDLLARAEGIVRLRREAEQKAAELIPALFLDMFGDPATNPKGWPTKNLGDFCRIIGGSSLPPGEPFTGQAEGRLLMKVSDMNATGNEVFVVSSKEWIPDQKRSYSSVGAGTIVFPKRGAAIATNKKRITTRSTLLDPNLMGVLPDEKVARTDYLFQWFSAFDLADISSGTTVPQLNKGDLSPLVVPIAPLNLQDKFQEKRTAILSIQSQQSAATAKAQETFDALLASVFIDRSRYE